MTTLDRQCAVVTGAAGAIGYATSERIAREGATVILADIEGHEKAAATLKGHGYDVHAIDLDVTRTESVESLVSSVMKQHSRIDILVNNAAIASVLKPSKFELLSEDLWRRVHDVNVLGVIRMCAAVSAHMRAARSGRIVNFASGVTYKGAPGLLHYVATKGALISITRSLASEFAPHNVLVHCGFTGFHENRWHGCVPRDVREILGRSTCVEAAQAGADACRRR